MQKSTQRPHMSKDLQHKAQEFAIDMEKKRFELDSQKFNLDQIKLLGELLKVESNSKDFKKELEGAVIDIVNTIQLDQRLAKAKEQALEDMENEDREERTLVTKKFK